MAKILLCRTTHLVEISDDNGEINEDMLRQIESLIEKNFCFDGISFEWISSNPVLLDTLSDNIGKCSNCGAWTTDCNEVDFFNDLSCGAFLKGQLFCDLCLPKGHVLKF
jgi:hypothetical protein